MAQQQHPDQHPTMATGSGAGRLVEKGWTVYDSLERPLGTVTDVDTSRGILEVDGRPVGFGTFEIPLDFVGQSGDNKVHLNKVIEDSAPQPDGAPRLVEPQTVTGTTSPSTRTRGRP